jgi:hypothetical protein
MTLAKKFGTPKTAESILDATRRSMKFARAMIDAGREDELATGMADSKLHAVDRIANVEKALANAGAKPAISGTARSNLVKAKKRFDGEIPKTVQEYWELLGSPAHRTWMRGFCVRALLDPERLLPPPAWAKDAGLTCVTSPNRSSVSDTRERFGSDYEAWFADADAKVKVSTPAELAKKKPGKQLVMIDPAHRQSIISIAHYSHEHWFVVVALASAKHPAPVFANHDDGEGYSDFLASDVRGWYSAEITKSIASVLSS